MDPVLRYARASRAAYWINDTALRPGLMPELVGLGLTLLGERSVESVGARLYAARDADTLVFAFQGTQDIQQWLADIRAIPQFFIGKRLATNDAHAHRGFISAWMSVRNWCDAVVIANHGVSRIVWTGHSLGGALATLAASDTDGPTPVLAYTFGSPRVGLSDFANPYNDAGIETVRVVHADDLVPRLPGVPYQHVRGVIRLRDDGSVIGPVLSWFGGFLGWEKAALDDLDLQSLRDHHVDRYVAACTAHANLTAAA